MPSKGSSRFLLGYKMPRKKKNLLPSSTKATTKNAIINWS
jgi:hypothetical protein